MIRLEFIGLPGPHRDIERFVGNVRAARPSATDDEIVTIVRRGNARFRPRWQRSLWQVFGQDILTADLTQLPVWGLLPPNWRQMLPLFPLDGGEVIPDTPEGVAALNVAIQAGNFGRINRRSLLRPAGLSRSYVWRRENAWVQEVADADVEALRRTPILNQCFRNVDQAEGPVTVRTFEYGEGERHGFRSFDELEAFRKDQERAPAWRGV